MNEEGRYDQDDEERTRPRVVDKRIAARRAAGEAVDEPQEPPRPQPTATEQTSAASTAPTPDAPSTPSPPPTAEPSAASASGVPTADAAHDPGVWTPEQEAEAQRIAEEIDRIPSIDWIVNSAVTLANVAGVKLQSDKRDEAQLAIDALAALLERIGSRMQEAEAPLRQTLAQLQLAFARGGPQ